MKFISQAEGYIEPDGAGGYDYVYQYKDHLGNVRLSYKDADDNGVIHGASTQIFFDDFEAASGWDGSGASWGQSITAFDDTMTFDGDYSGRIYGAMGTSVAVHSNEWVAIDNDSATDYIYTAWAYSESPIIRLGLGMKEDGEAGYLTLFDDILIIDELNKWVYVEKRVTVPAHITSLNVRIECAAWENRVGNVWFDNVSIRRVNAPLDVEIVEGKNYYPFGLQHKGYNNTVNGTENKFLTYNGVEFEESLDLNMYETDFRQYDPTLGRFSNSDRLAELAPSLTPYRFAFNNPVYWSDPSGLYEVDEDGNIVVNNENGNEEVTKLLEYLKNNEGASVDDIASHIFTSGDFAYDLDEVVVTAGNGSSEAAVDNISSQINSATSKISSFAGNINFTKKRNFAEWAWDNKRQIGVTVGAALNTYAGYQEIVAGTGMAMAPSGITQAAGGYAIADGIVRIASAPLQIYGTWVGNTSLENTPSNLLGSIGFLIDSGIEGDWKTGGRAHLVMELMGDFGLSRRKLIRVISKGFTDPNKWKNVINIGNATWQIVRPYKDVIELEGKLK